MDPEADAAAEPPAPPRPRRRHVLGLGCGVGLALPGLPVLALGGCTIAPDIDHAGPQAPAVHPLDRRVRVAWVFSSGGPRAFVHVGVVKALDALGVQPDLIVGASAGAMVGVLRAAGLRGSQLETLSFEVQPWQILRLALRGEERLSGAGLASWVNHRIGGRPLERLNIPVVCAAWAVRRRELVGFNAGDAGVAVQASTAIEGQFAPVRIRGEPHVDPDLHQPLPVRLARALGAERIVAVDASAHEDKAPPGTERWREGDLRKRRHTEPDARAADLLLHPDTGYYAGLTVEYRQRLIAIGERETLAQAARLRALHEARGPAG
jgi:NTE family protein